MKTNNTQPAQPADYKCIERWGKRIGSYDYYIQNEQAKAYKDNAPITAIYHSNYDGWNCAETIADKELRDFILNGGK
jgi:hypothetical protein|tara:strand:- start:374 stop:604 length:231 start_codon:yes stop_codon:yes gene_type:complete